MYKRILLLFERLKNVYLRIYFGSKAWTELVKDPLLDDSRPCYNSTFLVEVYHKH